MADATLAKSLLLVEDEACLAKALGFMLRHQGYELRHVGDGDAALAAVADRVPDLILLDIVLPGRSGYDVCQAIRRDPAYLGIKILMMSAKGGDMERRKALAMRADGFIAKPFSRAELQASLMGLLQAHTAGGDDV